MTGIKHDDNKLRYDLLPFESLDEIVRVLGLGANKYDDWNWQNLENLENRYTAALLRHISAHQQGEIIDSESGCYHLAHVGCCVLFLLWKLKRENK
jgi:hypothetical protein